jgi:hypothetical protein
MERAREMLHLRISRQGRVQIEKIAHLDGRTMSETARRLLVLGITSWTYGQEQEIDKRTAAAQAAAHRFEAMRNNPLRCVCGQAVEGHR